MKKELHFGRLMHIIKEPVYQERGRMSWEPKKTAVSALGLPRDVILGMAYKLVGRSQVNVENYRSI